MRTQTRIALLACMLLPVLPAWADDMPWAFRSGRGEGYGVALGGADPAPGTPVCAGAAQRFEFSVLYELQVKDSGKVLLVIQDENDHAIEGADVSKGSQPAAKGRGKVSLAAVVTAPGKAKEVRIFIPIVPDGVENTSGELVLRYPIRNCPSS